MTAPTIPDERLAEIAEGCMSGAEGLSIRTPPQAPVTGAEGEPVAWVSEDILAAMKRGDRAVPGWKRTDVFCIPLYASPPPASPSAPQGVEVRIKPLEWRNIGMVRRKQLLIRVAVTPFGRISITQDGDKFGFLFTNEDETIEWQDGFGTVETAQEAAFAYYGAAILSAIQTSPEAGRS